MVSKKIINISNDGSQKYFLFFGIKQASVSPYMWNHNMPFDLAFDFAIKTGIFL
jgi:hypothetical protein